MKKFTLTTVAVFGIVLGTASFAATGSDSKDVKVESKENKVELTYFSTGFAKVRVNIYDQRGSVVFTESIKHPKSFTKSYDLSKLPKGDYEFEIIDDQKVVSEIVKLAEAEKSGKVVSANVTESAEGKFTVKVIGEFVKPIQVNIYNNYGVLVYGDYIVSEKSFSRVYDFTNSKNKNVTFEVVQEDVVLTEAKF